jgi:hypothetical protein
MVDFTERVAWMAADIERQTKKKPGAAGLKDR